MSSAAHYNPHYTVTDYEQWRGDWELWNGVAVAMTPSPSFEHQRLAARLIFILESALRQTAACHCVVVHETDWHIADDMIVRPDVSVVCDPVRSTFIDTAPALIAEVLSPSTRDKDIGTKAKLYASEGVMYYVIIDPTSNTYEISQLVGSAYEKMAMPSKHRIDIRLHDGCEMRLDLAELVETT